MQQHTKFQTIPSMRSPGKCPETPDLTRFTKWKRHQNGEN